jgi:hypothetical protein
MYYNIQSAYRSKIDADKFFATSDEAKAYDVQRIKDYFGGRIEYLARDEYDGPFVNLFKFAVEWAAEERARPKPKAEVTAAPIRFELPNQNEVELPEPPDYGHTSHDAYMEG